MPYVFEQVVAVEHAPVGINAVGVDRGRLIDHVFVRESEVGEVVVLHDSDDRGHHQPGALLVAHLPHLLVGQRILDRIGVAAPERADVHAVGKPREAVSHRVALVVVREPYEAERAFLEGILVGAQVGVIFFRVFVSRLQVQRLGVRVACRKSGAYRKYDGKGRYCLFHGCSGFRFIILGSCPTIRSCRRCRPWGSTIRC